MTKQLTAGFIKGFNDSNRLDELSDLLDNCPSHHLNNRLWACNNYRPEVRFVLAHISAGVALKYYVSESELIASYRRINEPVYNDSCVEFFIAIDNDENYYNFEFNCMGTTLAGYGSGKHDRMPIPVSCVGKIKSSTRIRPIDGDINWELSLVIPFEVFVYHSITSFKDKECRVNFYKCGEKMSQPHFLSWSNIEYHRPNFHLPEFFGTLNFE